MTPIGILAGGGRLPLMLAQSIAARGRRVHIIAIVGEAEGAIARFPHTWVHWGEVGRIVATLRKQGCGELVIAGAVRRPDLLKLRPDLGLLKSLPQIVPLLGGGDDSVLRRVVGFLEGKGFNVRGAHEVAPELVAADGMIGKVRLSACELGDARLGFAVRRALAASDAGQAVVVAQGRVLAIEGVEGTDAMLGRLARRAFPRAPRSGVLAKGPKPGQELRVDMPVIGPRTVENALAAGLAGVVVEAGCVLILERGEMLALADREGCAVYGLAAHCSRPSAGEGLAHAIRRGRVIGQRRPSPRDRRDIERGLGVVDALASVGVAGAVVVARTHVLAIEAGEERAAMLKRAASLRQWGLHGSRRLGVFVCQARAGESEAAMRTNLQLAAEQRLAGVAVTGAESALAHYEAAARLADALKLFLVSFGQPQ